MLHTLQSLSNPSRKYNLSLRMVGRPVGQPHLLFLYLLRASAVNQKNVCIRLARRDDIPGIQSCNLKTLPENYATNFYQQHLTNWPYLAIVAEAISSDESTSPEARGSGPAPASVNSPPNEIVGYVLGRIETDMVKDGPSSRMRRQGHITSLAILPTFRRQGVASKLMQQVHHQMHTQYDAEQSSLHVRITNTAALRLYQESLGYNVASVIDGYYQDGEDAFLMQASLQPAPPILEPGGIPISSR